MEIKAHFPRLWWRMGTLSSVFLPGIPDGGAIAKSGFSMTNSLRVLPGARYPQGATVYDTGVNFCIISREATRVELLLYEACDSTEPFQVVVLDPHDNRTFVFWHVFIEGLKPGINYTWRVDGPNDTARSGYRFNPEVELVDPWARATTDNLWRRSDAMSGDYSTSIRAVVVDSGQYKLPSHAEDFVHPEHRSQVQEMVIYELHVGGFTKHPSSGVEESKRGCFAGLIEKIPYLKELGVTHVELLPVMAFDAQDVPPGVAEKGNSNYWGYSTHSFFSPHPGYCVTPEQGTHLREFRDMVDAMHEAGLQVILDVVFNHTAEGGIDGPTINFKGMGNEIFYHLEASDRSRYNDFTGCGNTVNCNQPLVTGFLLHCLEFWAGDMAVDGFRFDLASVLSRGQDGLPMAHPPIVWAIELSAVLANRNIIAEAWDAVGLYQVGHFPGYRWGEWNGRYRDLIREFVRGDKGLIAEVATRLTGSSDLYAHQGRHPFNSVNFITCHDGYTLWDLVSYQDKHNWDNGEENHDGHNDNRSWNCGVEGETDDPVINQLRRRQARNFMAILLLSQGVPMLLAGDEVLRSQSGNNNAWCQDNALSWFDWSLVEKNADMLRFTREMIALRRRHPTLMRRQFLTGTPRPGEAMSDITWHGHALEEPLWDLPDARVLAFTLAAVDQQESHLHVVLNMDDEAHDFPLPPIGHVGWHLAIDTGEDAPRDAVPPDHQTRLDRLQIRVKARSVVVLEGHHPSTG